MTRCIDFNQVIDSVRTEEVPLSIVVWWDHHGQAAWEACANARDLLRLLAYVDHRAAVKAVCACTRTVLQYVPAGEGRPLKAIETAEAWTRGEATEEECKRAAYAASAAHAAAADAAAYAAYAAHAAATAEAAAEAAAAAANSAASAAANAAVYAVCAANAADHGPQKWQQVYNQTLRDLAQVIRNNTACPTASQMARGSPASK